MTSQTCSDSIYTADQVEKALDGVTAPLRGNNKGVYYYDMSAAYDIETTSFYFDDGDVIDLKEKNYRAKRIKGYNPEKRAIMYVWQLDISGRIIIGRTWDEFVRCLNIVSNHFKLNNRRRLIIYVHNLAFEFQFMRKHLGWAKVFAVDSRTPVYAITTTGIEFRCSLLLSGYSLANLAKNMQVDGLKKLTGQLDYSLLRHSQTPLTSDEIQYCINDVKIVVAYIDGLRDAHGGIDKLPLTNTGFVRRLCRDRCCKFGHRRNLDYIHMIRDLTINSLSEFDALRRAYAGGYTHANALWAGETMTDVSSYDYCSSYPSVMLSERFPMSRGRRMHPKTFNEFKGYLEKYCVLFDVIFYGMQPKILQDNPLSESRCTVLKDPVINNGRVVSAKIAMTTITDVDYKIYQACYKWENITVSNVWIYRRGYLPREILLTILDLYKAKTELKGVKGREAEYLHAKGMLNSVYGMAVTNPMRQEYKYTAAGWVEKEYTDTERAARLARYNTSDNRFLYYPWGVWVTAYARRNLFSGILACGSDYIYSDTDSIKIINRSAHIDYISWYNEGVKRRLTAVLDYYSIDTAMLAPKTRDGTIKPLGVWEYEGDYNAFKTLGAKRYMVAKPGAICIGGVSYPISITVSGLNKYTAVPYIYNKCGGDIKKAFKLFAHYMHIPPDSAGKLTHTYLDSPYEGTMTDYTGLTAKYSEESAVHLEPTDYQMSITALYAAYLAGLHRGRYE